MPYAVRLIKAALVFGLTSAICAPAIAQNTDMALPTIDHATFTVPSDAPASPAWLITESHGSYLDPHGWLSSTNDTTVKLTSNLSLDITSGFSRGDLLSGYRGNAYTIDPSGGLYVPPGQSSFAALNPVASTFGGRVAMDLGGGLSLNFTGNLARVQDPAYAMNQRAMLGFNSNGTLSSEARAGVTMDFGNGSSLSISGGVSRAPAGLAACGMSLAFCH